MSWLLVNDLRAGLTGFLWHVFAAGFVPSLANPKTTEWWSSWLFLVASWVIKTLSDDFLSAVAVFRDFFSRQS